MHSSWYVAGTNWRVKQHRAGAGVSSQAKKENFLQGEVFFLDLPFNG